MHPKGSQGKDSGEGKEAAPKQGDPGRELVFLGGNDAYLTAHEQENKHPAATQEQDPKDEGKLDPATSVDLSRESECPRQPTQDKTRPNPTEKPDDQGPGEVLWTRIETNNPSRERVDDDAGPKGEEAQ
jgi:hypothetical protein